MKIRIACLDHELLWVIDDVIGGLYSIDRRTFETKCVLDFLKLFPDEKFEAQSLIKWKENCIIIIPLQIDKCWIIYNKVTGEIEYQKVVERKCRERLIAVARDQNQLYFFPLYIHEPALIVDMDTLICSKIIENWSSKLVDDQSETIWTGTYNGRYVFYPQRNSKNLVRLDCKTQKIDTIDIDISEDVIDVNYGFGELWVLPISGNKLYMIDGNGLIINTVELSVKDNIDSRLRFARIVVQKRYLFLLPCYRKGIYVYDKFEEKTHIIPEESLISHKKDKDIYLRYWEYCIADNQICFLPYLDQYIEINLDTLLYKNIELYYPKIWSKKERVWRIIRSHVSECDLTIGETDGCGVETFLSYIQNETDTKEFKRNGYVGKKIWDICLIENK